MTYLSPDVYAGIDLSRFNGPISTVISHKIYGDNLRLSVLGLNHIELATEEDKAYQIDCWARLFKAATWKEMKDLAEHNPIFTEATRTAVVLSEDEKIRLQCEAREDYQRRVGWKDDEIKRLTSENQRLRRLLHEAGISDK